ncbi:hypothetical protein BJV82DRAFT_714940 [Fennellomyces sp. T-0311]|nr:hypothetical protein BJV82DRAFT_714940 [Fennellomyces sp. T-0311]
MSGTKMQLTAAIIGTGFSGICAAIKLEQELGIKAQVFEMSKDIGGTWYVNTYPGAACDIPSHLYSLSFEPNPSWSERFSSQTEIHQYLQGVARKHGVYEQVKLETEVFRAEWKDQQRQWLLQWRNTQVHQHVGSGYFDIVISGVGGLRIPNIPKEFEGFSGPIVHTTWWDSNIDYTNKRVAIIGSGATAVQVIPELRKVASHVYSYQRTPNWIATRKQYRYSSIVKFIFRWVPFVMWMYRMSIFFRNEARYIAFGYQKTVGRYVQNMFKKEMTARLKRSGRPDLIPILTPDYPVGCKRICQTESYLEALAKDNVMVIRSGVDEIRGRTLVDKSGNETEVDILVLATGFNVYDNIGNLQIYGRDGVSLRDTWKRETQQAYKSVTIHGYPNFFMLLGPYSSLGHNSVVSSDDGSVSYVMKCIKTMKKNNIAAIEPKKSAQEEFTAQVQRGFEGTVWKGGCKSWYMNERGEISVLWNGTVSAFWWMLRRPNFKDFIQYKDAPAVAYNYLHHNKL